MDREDHRKRLTQIQSILHPITRGDDEVFLSSELADSMRQRLRNARPITDDNMATEW
jgi:hypothetical protein